MAVKIPQDFQPGDILVKKELVPYTGTPVVSVEGWGNHQTQVTFENGQIVEFFNGIQHEMQE